MTSPPPRAHVSLRPAQPVGVPTPGVCSKAGWVPGAPQAPGQMKEVCTVSVVSLQGCCGEGAGAAGGGQEGGWGPSY